MKLLAAIAAIGVCASAWLANAGEPAAIKKPGTLSQASTTANASNATTKDGRWCRTTNGSWVWVPSAANTPQVLTGRRFPNLSSIYYSDDGKPLRIGGIDWYLNGRGPFSD